MLLPTAKRPRDTISEHRAILEALSERSATGAADAMAAHLDEVMLELRRYASTRPDLFEA